MRLERFRISNFRSVNDSGWIDVADTTAFVGRNESGKTNLLQALASINGGTTLQELSRTRDFPADRLHSDYSDALNVVTTAWSLSDEERTSLAELLPDADSVTGVEVGRGYLTDRWVRFVGRDEPELPRERALELVKSVHAVPSTPGDAPDPIWVRALKALELAAGRESKDPRAWATSVIECLGGLQEPLASGRMELGEDARPALEELGDLATQAANQSQFESAANEWALRRMPRFLFLDQYPSIEGNQDLAEFVERQKSGRPTRGDAYFHMLLQVSGIDPAGLDDLLSAEPEVRRQTASRAGAVLTRTLRRIWTDRALKVRFNIDGVHFNTLVSDPTSVCDIEVNLNQRSRGFRWFFSFYVMFAAGTKDGSTANAILLLDEPGMHLHATGQRDLLNHLYGDLGNQVLFATQSPYMIPDGENTGLRTVESHEDTGTIALNDAALNNSMPLPADLAEADAHPDHDADEAEADSAEAELIEAVVEAEEAQTAEEVVDLEPSGPHPLESALENTAKMLSGHATLLVEEITDYWYLEMASEYLDEIERPALPKELEMMPLGNAAAIPLIVGALGDEAALLSLSSRSADKDADAQSKVSTLWIGDFLEEARGDQIDLEDLLDPDVYHRSVRFAYRDELAERDLELDDGVTRIVERYTKAFDALGLEFSRTRPARFILMGAAKKPRLMMTPETTERFARLFEAIDERCLDIDISDD